MFLFDGKAVNLVKKNPKSYMEPKPRGYGATGCRPLFYTFGWAWHLQIFKWLGQAGLCWTPLFTLSDHNTTAPWLRTGGSLLSLLPLDLLGAIVAVRWMSSRSRGRLSSLAVVLQLLCFFKVSYRCCERTTLWTSWAELLPSGSPPAAACCPASGVAPPPATWPCPLSPEDDNKNKTHKPSTPGH